MANPRLTAILNADILQEVFTYLSKHDLLAAVLVCWQWNSVAQRLLERTLELVASRRMQPANLHLLRRCQRDESLQRRVKNLVVKEWNLDDLIPIPRINGWIEDPWIPGRYFSRSYQEEGQASRETKELLAQMCYAMAKLRLSSFTWSAIPPAPGILLKQLGLQRACNVHIRRHERAHDAAAWTYAPILNYVQLRSLLQVSTQLVSLELFLPPENIKLLTSLGLLIASTENLKSLKLHSLGKLWGGNMVPSHMRPGLGSVFSTTSWMGWLQEPLSRLGRMLQLEELELDNFCVCQVSGLDIGSTIDLSRLRSVGLSCFSFLENSDSRARLNLQAFRLHTYSKHGPYSDKFCLGAWSTVGVREMLSSCDHLTDLELLAEGSTLIDKSLLETLGPNLTHLSLLTGDTKLGQVPKKQLLEDVSELCPQIRSLEFDIPPNGIFHSLCHSIPSMFPNLSKLTIRVGEEEEGSPFSELDSQRRSTTRSDVHGVWKQMATARSNLMELTLRCDSFRPWDRDLTFAASGRPYVSQGGLACTKFVVEATLPMRMSNGDQQVQVKCFEVEEARRAVRHGWQWLDGYFEMQNGWEERLGWAERVADEGRSLIKRRTRPSNE